MTYTKVRESLQETSSGLYFRSHVKPKVDVGRRSEMSKMKLQNVLNLPHESNM